MTLTVAYFTCRLNPRYEWFLRSFKQELRRNNIAYDDISFIVVDYYVQYDDLRKQNYEKKIRDVFGRLPINCLILPPKPTPWQGKHKTTSKDYFAASNARNTAFLHCKTSYIACIDDLSVVKEGWLEVVLWGMNNEKVLYGSYCKVQNLGCDEEGNITPEDDKDLTSPQVLHKDNRWERKDITNNFASRINGRALYGVSFALPMSIIEKINGFDEASDGQGNEDCIFGHRIGLVTSEIYYSKQMMTMEDFHAHKEEGNTKFKGVGWVKLTNNTLMKGKEGMFAVDALRQYALESKSPLPFIPATNQFQTIDWRTGNCISSIY